ncbi:MAG: hypothetical protein IKE22_03790 [Atopobiaceae bacterium]|nr:hypothetical protein [Atopobiaceae bacterium]
MQAFIDKVRNGVRNFMNGRYGSDQLGTTLVIVALVLTILSNWLGRWLSIVALVLLVIVFARMFSKNIEARKKENDTFISFLPGANTWIRRQRIKWANRKTKAYVRCPHCNAEFALPKGKGRLRATCPKCGEKSDHTV